MIIKRHFTFKTELSAIKACVSTFWETPCIYGRAGSKLSQGIFDEMKDVLTRKQDIFEIITLTESGINSKIETLTNKWCQEIRNRPIHLW